MNSAAHTQQLTVSSHPTPTPSATVSTVGTLTVSEKSGETLAIMPESVTTLPSTLISQTATETSQEELTGLVRLLEGAYQQISVIQNKLVNWAMRTGLAIPETAIPPTQLQVPADLRQEIIDQMREEIRQDLAREDTRSKTSSHSTKHHRRMKEPQPQHSNSPDQDMAESYSVYQTSSIRSSAGHAFYDRPNSKQHRSSYVRMEVPKNGLPTRIFIPSNPVQQPVSSTILPASDSSSDLMEQLSSEQNVHYVADSSPPQSSVITDTLASSNSIADSRK
jgi:hypothetical protein